LAKTSFSSLHFCFRTGSYFFVHLVNPLLPLSTSALNMSSSPLKVNDVVYGIGGAFDKRLGKVTKLNPAKPAVEDGAGRRSCYWRENLKRVGSISSIFGRCSVCKRPGEVDEPCPYNGIGKHRCQGIIRGNFDWKMKIHTPPLSNAIRETGQHTMGLFLAKQLGAALFRLGFSEVPDDIIDSLKHGLREASTERRGLALALPFVAASSSAADPKVPEI
jgi:hypothetical protein